MPRYDKWYEKSTGTMESRTYGNPKSIEQERSLARAWGWDSSIAFAHRKGNNKTGKDKFVVSYTRTPSAVAAADVKHHWAHITQSKFELSRIQRRIKGAAISIMRALDAARTTETDPITLETQLRAKIQAAKDACLELTYMHSEISKHHEAALTAHQNITMRTPLISGMDIPAPSAIQTSREQHTSDHTEEINQAKSLVPALAAQKRVVTAVQEWQAAIRDRWTAQRAYMPVDTWWERLSVKMEAKPRPTPAVPVSREAVETQVLRADEVGPEDETWKQAEAEVAKTEAALLDAIQARDVAMAEVARAFGVAL